MFIDVLVLCWQAACAQSDKQQHFSTRVCASAFYSVCYSRNLKLILDFISIYSWKSRPTCSTHLCQKKWCSSNDNRWGAMRWAVKSGDIIGPANQYREFRIFRKFFTGGSGPYWILKPDWPDGIDVLFIIAALTIVPAVIQTTGLC